MSTAVPLFRDAVTFAINRSLTSHAERAEAQSA